jgi:hypothetical protein
MRGPGRVSRLSRCRPETWDAKAGSKASMVILSEAKDLLLSHIRLTAISL